MVHVAYCFDKNFEPLFGASLMSLLLNFRSAGAGLTVHVVTDNHHPGFQEKIEHLRSAFAARIELYVISAADIQAMAALPVTRQPHVTHAGYYRLLLARILPETAGKVLYLDADTIVLSDVGALYATDMAGAPVSGVSDLAAERWKAEHQLGRYINSGVLLIDLEQWRREDHAARCLDYIANNREKLLFGEQCAQNLVFQDSLQLLDARWNHYVLPHAKTQVSGDAAILHFVTRDKPSHAWYENPLGKYYWRYLDVSPWAGAVPILPTTLEQAYRFARLLHRQGKVEESIATYEKVLVSMQKSRQTRNES